VIIWWRVWTSHPSSIMTCGCVDAGREVWYLEWVAYAIVHAHNLWYSQWVFYPNGVNVLADTSVSILGIVMTPITLIFGPVASMNLLSTVTPVLTALSMFWLLRRWVQWAPAAFVGGLLYGFSSFVVVQLTLGWLNIAFLALLPLMVGCLDELLIRQRRSPITVGIGLGVLVAAQFFVSSEMLLLCAIAGVIAVALLVAYSQLHDPVDLHHRLQHSVRGLGAAAIASVVLLIVPVLFFLYGPAHLGTVVWTTTWPGNLGNTIANFWSNTTTLGPLGATLFAAEMHRIGGYQGPALPSEGFLGWGLIAVIVVGIVVWRRDRRLWFWGALGVLTALLSLRAVDGEWGPWALVDHLPLLENVTQGRFSAIVDLCAGVVLAIVIDRLWSAVVSRRAGTPHPRLWASGAVAVMTLVAVAPVVAGVSPNVPVTVEPVAVPSWFSRVAPHLPSGQVLLTYPTTSFNSQTPLVWQAMDRMSFRMIGGGGPAGTASRAGGDRAGYEVLDAASVTLEPPPTFSLQNLKAVGQAIRDWRVTMVVVPDQRELPPELRGRSNAFAVAFFTAVLGAAPIEQDGAWVWRASDAPGPIPLPTKAVEACTLAGLPGMQAAGCVLASHDGIE
jgi:hypothetical protein